MKDIHSRRAAEDMLIAKASRDEAFRKQLIENPRGAIASALGIRVPADVTVEVLEETPRTLYLVLPVTIHAAEELSEKDLELVAGGVGSEADDAWGKVKGFFGSDGGLADTTEA
jgi:hypothetical protein